MKHLENKQNFSLWKLFTVVFDYLLISLHAFHHAHGKYTFGDKFHYSGIGIFSMGQKNRHFTARRWLIRYYKGQLITINQERMLATLMT